MPLIYSLNQYFTNTVATNKNFAVAKHPKYEQSLFINLATDYRPIHFALTQWINPRIQSFSSISEAKRILGDKQKLWNYYPYIENGRGKLIEEQLFPIKATLYKYLNRIPEAPIGAWTLLSKNQIVYSCATTATVPYGVCEFEQNKVEPPSRAYLKLWEFFTRTRLLPKKGLQAIDLGASPGGWTWVLSSLFNEIIAIDRSPLHENLLPKKNIKFLKQDVMSFPGKSLLEKNAWIFSDVALEPRKITSHLLHIKKERPDISIVCTLKFTHKTDLKLIAELEELHNSNFIHLYANKHEVTWYSINREAIDDCP